MRRALFVLVALLLATGSAHAEAPMATFALIIGVNRGADRDLPPLRYADDDAARYQELFRLLGARTYLLARLDENTRRLHPQAAAEANTPRRLRLERAVRELGAEIRRAQQRHIRTALYFVFAGHGNVKEGEAYLSLEDARIDGEQLNDIIGRAAADETHVIVDACHSGLLAMSRGPGGRRRPLSGFSQIGALVSNPRVGLLLSTTSGRESHEWEAFQAGVFSHEIRSGLYGAADANLDGKVTYREIAAFVQRANAAVPNERFRPDVYARPPNGSDLLVDVRRALERRLDLRSKTSAHWLLENDVGVRIADFHPQREHEMRIARPPGSKLYLRRLATRDTAASSTLDGDAEEEYVLPAADDVVELADLEATSPRVAMRGAAHESFGLLFSLPFDSGAVDSYRYQDASAPRERDVAARRSPAWRQTSAIVAFGLAAAAAVTGVGLVVSADRIRADDEAGASQRSIADRNDRVTGLRLASYVAFGASGVSALAGAVLVWWPTNGASATAYPMSTGIGLSYRAPID